MKIRINALPEECADFIAWLTSKKAEVRIVTCSDMYCNTHNPRDETVRYYLEVRPADAKKSAQGKGGVRHG